ncbi:MULTISPECIES: hypothetical protein [unclassified Comamonas]|nr:MULTISPECIES: hypothetical protein [unclassified Comamonas]
MGDSNSPATFGHAARKLDRRKIAFLRVRIISYAAPWPDVQ